MNEDAGPIFRQVAAAIENSIVDLQVVVSGAPMLAFIFTGVGIGVVYKR